MAKIGKMKIRELRDKIREVEELALGLTKIEEVLKSDLSGVTIPVHVCDIWCSLTPPEAITILEHQRDAMRAKREALMEALSLEDENE